MNNNSKLALTAGLAILLLGAYLSSTNAPAAGTKQQPSVKTNPTTQQSTQQTQQTLSPEGQKVLDALKKILLLPEKAIPDIRIISDVDLLKKSQPLFFASAKNGFYLIRYSDFAIVYDMAANKIMKLAPITPEKTT